MNSRGWIGSSLLLLVVAATATGLAAWKRASLRADEAASANPPEPVEAVAAAVAVEREHVPETTSIGTVLALESVTLRNEIAGTVKEVALVPGAVVEQGALLVALDVSVEEAELAAQEARTKLAETLLGRMQHALENRGASAVDVDRAGSELDVARAEVARIRAVIERKTIRAPFRARVGLADVHPGQYLDAGTHLTTLQGVGEAVDVDFAVTQDVAASLRVGGRVDVSAAGEDTPPAAAEIVALDARVDPVTRNAWVRARIAGTALVPGASVRVRVPVGQPRAVVAVPASALRKGPGGDHVFVLADDDQGRTRAHLRAVHTGPMLADEVVILDGLASGERVAASGSFKLRDGVLVVISGAAIAGGADAAGGAR